MVALLIILSGVAVVAVAWFALLPANTFMIFRRPDGGSIVVGRGSIRSEPPPKSYPTNGFDHLAEYLAKLQSSTKGFKSALFATEAGDRACSFWSRDGDVEVALSVDWRTEPEREARIRAFFGGRAVEPSEDYLSDNGNEVGSIRNLTYPLADDLSELTRTARAILEDLCGITATDSLKVTYTEGRGE